MFEKDLTVVLECLKKIKKDWEVMIPEGNAWDVNNIRFQRGTVHQKEGWRAVSSPWQHIEMAKKHTKVRTAWREIKMWALHEPEVWRETRLFPHGRRPFGSELEDFQGEIRTMEEQNQDFELSHWPGWGVASPFQQGGVLHSKTNLNSRLSNTKLS